MNEQIKLFIMTTPSGFKIPGVTFANGLTVLKPDTAYVCIPVFQEGELALRYPECKMQYFADLSPEQVNHWITNQVCDDIEGIEMGFDKVPNAQYVASERRRILRQFNTVQE
jgi:hypothetical protein